MCVFVRLFVGVLVCVCMHTCACSCMYTCVAGKCLHPQNFTVFSPVSICVIDYRQSVVRGS